MRIKNVGTTKILISDLIVNGYSVELLMGQERVIFDEIAEKSYKLQALVNSGKISILSNEEPNPGLDLNAKKVAQVTSGEVDPVLTDNDGQCDTVDATEINSAIALVNDLKAKYNSAQVQLEETHACLNLVVGLLNEIRTKLDTMNS